MKNATPTPDEKVQNATVRSLFYQQLCRLFAYPTGPNASPSVQASADALYLALDALPHSDQARQKINETLNELQQWIEQAEDCHSEACLSVYTALFDNCTGRAAVPLYEKEYGNGDAKTIWEELIRFYEHFGLQFDVAHSHDWPDHLGTELEFMHYLSYREATADQEDQAVYLRGQEDFLCRRLSRWVGKFSEHLNQKEHSGPYGIYARLVDQYISAEMKWLDLEYLPQMAQIPLRAGATSSSLHTNQLIPLVDQTFNPT